jgi:hypothetical protein
LDRKRRPHAVGTAAAGLAFEEIARRLATTKGSALSRYHRLNGIVFKSRSLHSDKARLARAQAGRERRERQAAAIARPVAAMLDRIAGGTLRAEAIRMAREEGLTFGAIGAALGITRQAAHQATRSSAGRRVRAGFS